MEKLISDNFELIRKLSETKSALREFGEDKFFIKYVLEYTRSSTKKFMTELENSRSAMEGQGLLYGAQN